MQIMKKATIMVAGIAMAAIMVAGCGSKQPSVPKSVATVNGHEISRDEYYAQLSRTYGRQVLPAMLEEQVILTWADKEKVPPTDEQINKQINILKREGLYDEQVKRVGGEDALKDQMRSQQAMINLAKKFYKTNDAQLEAAYNSMRDRYVHGPRKQVAVVINQDQNRIQEFAKTAGTKEDFEEAAKESLGQSPIVTWIADGQKGVPEPLAKAVADTKVGQVSKVFSFTVPQSPMMGGGSAPSTLYGVLKVTKIGPKADLKFKQVKDEVADYVAMQQMQTDPSFRDKLAEQKKKADIKINISDLKDVADQFKNPPSQMQAPTAAPRPAPKAAAPKK